ncbi:MAG: ABC transporter substrate-binding protein [Hyphomicrobiales bacterium]|nr:ABC transporter substrate-binding protein [Hyphomicrobiales bacterium]
MRRDAGERVGRGTSIAAAVAAAWLVLAGPAEAGGTAEVMHWLTSGGEARALGELRAAFEAAGGRWIDAPVVGGGGDAAMVALRGRLVVGRPPTAILMKRSAIREWGGLGRLASVEAVAAPQGWDAVLPPIVATAMKHGGRWVAAPIGIHRVNWLWADPAALARVGASPPRTWAEFDAVAEKLRAAGITPLAHGGQPWQDGMLFEVSALSVGGPAFYRRAFVDLDRATLTGPTMRAVFERLGRLRGDLDRNRLGRDWNVATAMVLDGRAAFQIMGDWAKGEITATGRRPGVDILCLPLPGEGFDFTVDAFAFFAGEGAGDAAGRETLAATIMSPAVQARFNRLKGSIPARTDVPLEGFDACATKARLDFLEAEGTDAALPSFTFEADRSSRAAIVEVANRFLNSDMTPKDATQALAKALDRVR